MRRVMFLIAATVLMAGAIPASALAHGHHHARHHAHHARFRHFGNDSTPPANTNASDNAGTVQSFQNGVLTITLNDTSTVKGMVTNDTELECTSTQPSTTTHDEGDGSGDQSTGEDQSGSGGDDQQSSGGDDQGDNNQGDNEQGDDNQGEDQNENQAGSCSTSNLTPGAVVHEASLRIGGSGAVWQKVELVS